MALIDERGRLFGKLNLVDGAALIFLLGLLPIGYGAYLLFRPASPHIDSVTEVPLTREELRIANGVTIGAKLKVRGSGFNPLLRALVGDTPALGFVFENPNSADVVIGELPLGKYDLVLYDGVQEVARAVGAVSIQSREGVQVRAVGRLNSLDAAAVQNMKPGYRSTEQGRAAYEVVAIGSPQPAMSRIPLGNGGVDVPIPGSTEYPAVLLIGCDPGGGTCSIGGVSLGAQPPIRVLLPGGYGFAIDELLPTAPPTPAHVEVEFDGPHVRLVTAGDRDALLDERAAIVRSVAGRRATVALGADRSREGWSYRGRPLRIGAPFRLQTDQYEIAGTIVNLHASDTAPKTGQ
jgi:hypothetical protein